VCQTERKLWEVLGVGGRINLKSILQENNLVLELNWFRIATDSWLLSTQKFGFPYNGENFQMNVEAISF
jgi:hypothetical protein